MVLSNHDAPLRVEMGDGRIVCLDVSSQCKGNMRYFKQLGKILEHPNTPSNFMSYLLKRDLSNWIPQDIPNTKMKVETMRGHLPNPIRFIFHYGLRIKLINQAVRLYIKIISLGVEVMEKNHPLVMFLGKKSRK